MLQEWWTSEALLENTEYGPRLVIFSYSGVILHVANQEWPKPLHFVMVDPNTKMPIAPMTSRTHKEGGRCTSRFTVSG